MIKELVLTKLGLRPRLTSRYLLRPLLGVVATSAAAGATLAILFAPKSGKEVRKDLAEGAWAGTRMVGQAAVRAKAVAQSARNLVARRSDEATPAPELEVSEVEAEVDGQPETETTTQTRSEAV